MRVYEDKLRPGLSYPIKTGAVEKALLEAGITLECYVHYHASLGDITAYFWALDRYRAFESVSISVSAVTSENVVSARVYVQENILPEIIAFFAGIIALPSNSTIRRENQDFRWSLPL